MTWEPQVRRGLATAFYRRWATAENGKKDDNDRQRALEEAKWVVDRYPGDRTARMVLKSLERAEEKEEEEENEDGETTDSLIEAQLKLKQGVQESRPAARIALLQEAAGAFDECVTMKHASDAARMRVVREAAGAHYELAKTYWPPGLLDKGKAEQHHRPGFAHEEYSIASRQFAEVSEYWQAKLGELPKDRKQAIKKLLADHADYAELLAAEGDAAASLRGIACVAWAHDEPDAKEKSKQAFDACRRVWATYAITPVGSYTGLRGAEVLLVTGDAKGALELTDAVLKGVDQVYSIKAETIADLRFSAELLRITCLSDENSSKQDEAIAYGEEWLNKQEGDSPVAKIRAVEMRAQVAFAYFMRWKLAAADERDDKDRETAWDHAIWIERRHRGNETARRVLREIDLEMLKMRMK